MSMWQTINVHPLPPSVASTKKFWSAFTPAKSLPWYNCMGIFPAKSMLYVTKSHICAMYFQFFNQFPLRKAQTMVMGHAWSKWVFLYVGILGCVGQGFQESYNMGKVMSSCKRHNHQACKPCWLKLYFKFHIMHRQHNAYIDCNFLLCGSVSLLWQRLRSSTTLNI